MGTIQSTKRLIATKSRQLRKYFSEEIYNLETGEYYSSRFQQDAVKMALRLGQRWRLFAFATACLALMTLSPAMMSAYRRRLGMTEALSFLTAKCPYPRGCNEGKDKDGYVCMSCKGSGKRYNIQKATVVVDHVEYENNWKDPIIADLTAEKVLELLLPETKKPDFSYHRYWNQKTDDLSFKSPQKCTLHFKSEKFADAFLKLLERKYIYDSGVLDSDSTEKTSREKRFEKKLAAREVAAHEKKVAALEKQVAGLIKKVAALEKKGAGPKKKKKGNVTALAERCRS